MKYKLENKDLDIKELKKMIKNKTDEMSETQVRKDKAEKRLQDANREAELMREKLQRKLDDAQETLKRKEKEYEDTLEHLQKDMDSLESERGELKNRLKETTMKALLEGMARGSPSLTSSPAHSSGSYPSMGPSVPAPVKDSPMLTRQVQDLQQALIAIREERARQQGQELKAKLAKMKPIIVPKKDFVQSPTHEKKDASKDDQVDARDLSKRLNVLKEKLNKALMDSASVTDLSQPLKVDTEIPGFTPTTKHVNKPWVERELQKETELLKEDISNLIWSRKPGGKIQADFREFPTPLMSKAMLEKDFQVVGRVKLAPQPIKTVPLIIGPQDLRQIHQTVIGY